VAEATALARITASASQMITTPTMLADRIREWREIAHVLTPAVQISAIAQQYEIAVSVVVLDTTVDKRGIGPEVYSLGEDGRGVPWLSRGECAIGKVGLLKISQAAGVTWDPRYCGRTDDRRERYYWEYKAVGSYVDFTGASQTIQATFELDLRDGSPALKGFTGPQIDATRRAGLRICESKAMNAAIRELGIRQKYQIKDLEKPFVIFRVMFVPDMKDPMQRRLVTERALAGSAALYPAHRQIETGAPPEVIDVTPERQEPVAPATAETPAGTVNTTTGEIVEEKPAAPPAPTGPTITRIDPQSGKARDTGRPYTKSILTLSDGRTIYTFDKDVAKLADTFMREKTPIEVTPHETKWGVEIVELQRATAQLPYDDNDPAEADLPKL
jgi:hypothetical protein